MKEKDCDRKKFDPESERNLPQEVASPTSAADAETTDAAAVEVPVPDADELPLTSGEEKQDAGEESEKESSAGEEKRAEIPETFASFPKTRALLEADAGMRIGREMGKFMDVVEGFMHGSAFERSEIDDSLSLLFRIGKGYEEGTFTLDMLEMLLKGITHERRSAERERAAELRGRNARIEEFMREPAKGDGLPHLGGTPSTRRSRARGIFSLAETAR